MAYIQTDSEGGSTRPGSGVCCLRLSVFKTALFTLRTYLRPSFAAHSLTTRRTSIARAYLYGAYVILKTHARTVCVRYFVILPYAVCTYVKRRSTGHHRCFARAWRAPAPRLAPTALAAAGARGCRPPCLCRIVSWWPSVTHGNLIVQIDRYWLR